MMMKMNKIFKSTALLMIAIFCCLSVSAQRNVAVKSFSSIGVSNGIDLYLTQGTSESVTIKGNADLIKDVIVEQNGTSINIKYKEGINWGRLFKNESIKVYITFKTLTGLAASGGSDVYTQNSLKLDQLNIAASGGSDLKLTLNCKELKLTISGGSDAELKGSGENMILTASGGSDIDAFGYQVNNARILTSGGCDANVYVNKALEVMASGGSDLNYKGNPSVKKRNDKSSDVTHVD
jgi:hypothetical protein